MWDLLVGPGGKTDAVSLPGSAVLEVRSGAGLVTIDGKPQAVRMGSTFAIDEGSKFSIDNGQQHGPLSIRAIVISSQRE
jgi:mannose-6-phosphate isomerase-like protein (cupin superfamily)